MAFRSKGAAGGSSGRRQWVHEIHELCWLLAVILSKLMRTWVYMQVYAAMNLSVGIRSLRQASSTSLLRRACSRGSAVRLRTVATGAHAMSRWREVQCRPQWGRAGFATEAAPSAFASEHDYHVAADATLERVSEVVEQLEEHLDDFESNLVVGEKRA